MNISFNVRNGNLHKLYSPFHDGDTLFRWFYICSGLYITTCELRITMMSRKILHLASKIFRATIKHDTYMPNVRHQSSINLSPDHTRSKDSSLFMEDLWYWHPVSYISMYWLSPAVIIIQSPSLHTAECLPLSSRPHTHTSVSTSPKFYHYANIIGRISS